MILKRQRPAIHHRAKADATAATMALCEEKRKVFKLVQSFIGSLVIISYLFVTDEAILNSSYSQSGSLRWNRRNLDEKCLDCNESRGSPVNSRRELANLERKLMPIFGSENSTVTSNPTFTVKVMPLRKGIEAKKIKTTASDESKPRLIDVEGEKIYSREDYSEKQPETKTFDGIELSAEDATTAPKSFHIFQASPPHSRSTIATNWLMGLFEPDADFSFMINRPNFPVRQSRKYIDVNGTIVTKTHNIQLQTLYNTFRPDYDEVFFVVTQKHSEDNSKTRLNDEDLVCRYKNVLCLEFEEFSFQNQKELTHMVHKLTMKLKTRFQYFFGGDSEWFDMQHELNAVDRLEEMVSVTQTMEGFSFRQVTSKHGIHGGQFAALFKNYGENSVAEG